MIDVNFQIPGPLRGKQRPRSTKMGRMYTPKETVNAEAYIKFLAAEAMGDEEPLEGPIKLVVYICVEIPMSFSKTKRAAALEGLEYPTTKPDLDNCVKLLADAMNGVVYKDDKQIVTLVVSKLYSSAAHTRVYISRAGVGDD